MKKRHIQLMPALLVVTLAIATVSTIFQWTPEPSSGKIPTVDATVLTTYHNVVPKDSSTEKEYGAYTLYEVCMYKFIAIEGIILDDYYCAAGYRTFGIGCVVDTPEEQRMVSDGLTYEEVRLHLEKEFTKVMNIVERDAPKLYSKDQKAALAMLFLSIGYERFWNKNKKLWAGYKSGQGIPERVWLRQCNYKTPTGKWVRSDHIYSSKRFEVDLFYGRKKSVEKQARTFKSIAIKFQKRLGVWSSKTQRSLHSALYTPLQVLFS